MRSRLCSAAASGLAVFTCAPATSLAQEAPPPAPVQSTQPSTAELSADGPADIIVTAQRRSESLQRTPVAVSVLTSETLQSQAVFTQTDLQRTVPGLTVRATSNSNDLNFAIRGQTVDAFSSSTSAVVSYFNEVPISPNSSTSFFDLASVQVLKGPQGTLFGRNATGGAVLFTSAAPVHRVEGYAIGRYGNYDSINLEGAINLPIVADRVALRVAGSYQKRDGYAFNLFNNQRVGNVDLYGLRGSLLTKLSDAITNTVVVDFNHAGGNNLPNSAYSAYAVGSTNNGVALEGTGSLLFSPALDTVVNSRGAWAQYLAAHPKSDPDGLVGFTAKQRARGPYLVNVDGSLRHRANIVTVTNTTAIEVADNATLKNIFGFGRSRTSDGADYDGTSYGIESLGRDDEQNTGFVLRNRTYTDELQLGGKTNALQYTVGIFYSNFEQRQVRDIVRVFDLSPVIPVTIQSIPGTVSSESYAAYAQGTYDLTDLTGLAGLSIVAGGRYTISKEGLRMRPAIRPTIGQDTPTRFPRRTRNRAISSA